MAESAFGDGFIVDPAKLDGLAGTLGRCYDDFNAATGEFARGASESGAQAFGDLRDAWTSFNDAWSNELLTTKTAIAELIGKVSSAADTYRDTEYRIEKMIRNMLAGLFE